MIYVFRFYFTEWYVMALEDDVYRFLHMKTSETLHSGKAVVAFRALFGYNGSLRSGITTATSRRIIR